MDTYRTMAEIDASIQATLDRLEKADYQRQQMQTEFDSMTPEERERMEADLATREERWN